MSKCHNCGVQLGANATACSECGAAVHDGHGQNDEPQAEPSGATPRGLKLTSVVAALTGLLLLALGGANWVWANQYESSGAEGAGEVPSMIADLAVALAILGLVAFVATYGLWRLRGWGWLVGMGYFAVHALAGVVFFMDGVTGMIGYAAVVSVLMGYLWQQRDLYGPSRYVPGRGPQTQPR